MDYKTIVNLMKEMSHADLTKLEIEEESFRICIEKGGKDAQPNVQGAMPNQNLSGYTQYSPAFIQPPSAYMQMLSPSTAPTGVSLDTPGGGANQETAAEEINHKKLVSPMVGTFYAQPSPDKPPFVKVGDRVKKGQTICIIEAMKLMNEIECEQEGEIVKVLTSNEDMVEFGQPLFLIR